MIEKPIRIVLDTNVFVSAHLWPDSLPAHAYRRSVMVGDLLLSCDWLGELDSVFRRPKFDRYSPLAARIEFLDRLIVFAEMVSVRDAVEDCWDPKDNMILELALSGAADFIVTGDDHLLRLAPWRGVRIVTPAVFLEAAGPS